MGWKINYGALSLRNMQKDKHHMLNHFLEELWPHYCYLRDLWAQLWDVNDKVYKAAPSLCLQKQRIFSGRTGPAWRCAKNDICQTVTSWAALRKAGDTFSHGVSRHQTVTSDINFLVTLSGTVHSLPHPPLLLRMSQRCLLCPVRLNQTAFLTHFKNLTNSISG